jgi:hypothetical protein
MMKIKLKNLSWFIFCLIVFGNLACEVFKPIPKEENRKVDLQLEELPSRYINLIDFLTDTITIAGNYEGDRLVFRGAVDKVLFFQNCQIRSIHPEDAIAFDGPARNLIVYANGLKIKGGGVTFWDVADNVKMIGGSIDSTHTGIRATRDLPHKNINISEWNISNATHEGIYLGPSQASDTPGSGFIIQNNTFVNTAWDAIQVGNVKYYVISGNNISNAGTAAAYGQDYGITVNPGSVGYLFNNIISNTKKPVQILDARAFFHAPSPN